MHRPARHCPALADPVLCTSIRRTATACHQKCAWDFIKERMTAEETVLVVGCAHSRTLKGNERLLLMELIKTGGAPRGEYVAERKQIHFLLRIHRSGVTQWQSSIPGCRTFQGLENTDY